jgi:hypothetical protein
MTSHKWSQHVSKHYSLNLLHPRFRGCSTGWRVQIYYIDYFNSTYCKYPRQSEVKGIILHIFWPSFSIKTTSSGSVIKLRRNSQNGRNPAWHYQSKFEKLEVGRRVRPKLLYEWLFNIVSCLFSLFSDLYIFTKLNFHTFVWPKVAIVTLPK